MTTAGGQSGLGQQLGDEENRPIEALTMPTTLKTAGYATGFVGKWHLGFNGPRATWREFPGSRGKIDDPAVLGYLKHNFDLTRKTILSSGYDFADALYHDNLQPENFPGCAQKHNQDWITDRAIRFIEEHQGHPFFLSVNTTLVHGPGGCDAAVTALGPAKDQDIRITPPTGTLNGKKWLDAGIDAIVARIDSLGLGGNTVIVVAEDNPHKGRLRCNTAAHFCVVRWTGRVPAGTISQALIQNVDIAPTLFELAGATTPSGTPMDGVSFASVLIGRAETVRTSIYTEFITSRAVLDLRGLHYIANRAPVRSAKAHHDPTEDLPDQLYDRRNDPSELRNLVDDPAYFYMVESPNWLNSAGIPSFS